MAVGIDRFFPQHLDLGTCDGSAEGRLTKEIFRVYQLAPRAFLLVTGRKVSKGLGA